MQDNQEKTLQDYVESVEGSPANQEIKIPAPEMPWQREEMPLGNRIGLIPLKIEDLPTRGLFYPKDTTIAIRSATGAEIRHWSTLQEDDPARLDDMVNYVIERCVVIKSNDPKVRHTSWKDIKEVDRFYLLLAIHELTFANGENKLQIKISDTKNIEVIKDMISYIKLDTRLMKYYNEEERCFVLNFKSGKSIQVDMPCVGVTQFLKNYIIRKQQYQEYIDEDYLSFAPFVIRNWRGLSDDMYNHYIEDSQKWDVAVISVLTEIRNIFADAIDPVVTYKDEGGVTQTAPLNFQGGIKSLFLISNPFDELV